MDNSTKNRISCLDEKIEYAISVLDSGILQLENDVMEMGEDSTRRNHLQAQLNAYGNAVRNLRLAITAINSVR